jgi:hypothetical protein
VVSDFPLLILALSCVMQPNPLVDALEAVIGEDLSLGGALEPVQADFEVCTFSSFIKHGLNKEYFEGREILSCKSIVCTMRTKPFLQWHALLHNR